MHMCLVQSSINTPPKKNTAISLHDISTRSIQYKKKLRKKFMKKRVKLIFMSPKNIPNVLYLFMNCDDNTHSYSYAHTHDKVKKFTQKTQFFMQKLFLLLFYCFVRKSISFQYCYVLF